MREPYDWKKCPEGHITITKRAENPPSERYHCPSCTDAAPPGKTVHYGVSEVESRRVDPDECRRGAVVDTAPDLPPARRPDGAGGARR